MPNIPIRRHTKTLAIIAIVFFVTSVLWLTAIKAQEWQVQLDALNIFFVLTTFASLAFNVLQWQDRKLLLLPVRNPLIGLFNDLKARQQRCWNKGRRLDQSTRLQDFHDFIDEMVLSLDQAREHVLALIETVAPNLSDQEFFRASLRGLTAEEKEDRAEWRRKRRFELDREERRRATRAEYEARTTTGTDRPVVMMTRPPGLRRGYQQDLWAYLFRTVSGEYTWAVEDAADKVVIADGIAQTLDSAQREADTAAATDALTDWHPYPLVQPQSTTAVRES